MTQKISFQYRDPEDTELMNRRWEGIVEPGVKRGFEVTLGTDPPQTTITIRPGVLVTNDYCRVEETEPIKDHSAEELHHQKMKAKMIMQVHDELVFDVPQAEAYDLECLVKQIMESDHPDPPDRNRR